MPRNTMGGSRAKKQGNKHSGGGGGGGGGQYAGVRRANEGELYAVALRVFGSGRVQVIGNDGMQRLLEIRGKFKGRNRRRNEVKIGGLLLVGDRAWTINPSGTNQQDRVCDLLCVYEPDEVRTLRREGALNTAMFKAASSKFDTHTDDSIAFDDTGGEAGEAKSEVAADTFDPYAGMPAFTDDEETEDEDGGSAAAAPVAAPAERRGLFDDDDEVNPDDI
jgi:initiation factor 1A